MASKLLLLMDKTGEFTWTGVDNEFLRNKHKIIATIHVMMVESEYFFRTTWNGILDFFLTHLIVFTFAPNGKVSTVKKDNSSTDVI